MKLKLESSSPKETELIGFILGSSAKAGLMITLKGDLGAGKTLLTKGIARGLGVPKPEYVNSPTFTIHKVYEGRLTLNHMDFYRLGEEDELLDLGLDEALGARGVSVIEWPDNFFPLLGDELLMVEIKVGEGDKRTLTFDWKGALPTEAGESLLKSRG
jgi:tRNA threonylcarbamoyladenosine biosynthesis protein TsaE